MNCIPLPTEMVSSRVQLSKALYLIVLTEFGSTMEVMALQSTKAVV